MSVFLFSVSSLPGITIELDYTYDTNNFFGQTGAKEAMRAVADFYEERLQDNLLEINQTTFGSGVSWTALFTHPGTGSTQSAAGLVVPEDTIVIYVGGRDLGGSAGRAGPGGFSAGGTLAWIELLNGRGQAGALTDPATDFGPWGGSISFDTERTWHFQLDGRPAGTSSNFVSVALHEMAHVLGVGTADSWIDQIDSENFFHGSRSTESFGEPVPVDSFKGHWQDDESCELPSGYDPDNPLNVLSLSYVSFGTSHGEDQIALMDPSLCTIDSATQLAVLTDLDWAGLADIGWEVFLPLELSNSDLGPSGVGFDWPTSTGQSYSLERSTDLDAGWVSVSGTVTGDGATASYSDASPPSDQAFYRLVSVDEVASASASADPIALSLSTMSAESMSANTFFQAQTVEPRVVEGCGHRH